jgi:hypothetical protein
MTTVYDTEVLTGKVMSPRQLKTRGQEGWTLGGVAQSVENLPTGNHNGRPCYQTVYHYHFWKKKESS